MNEKKLTNEDIVKALKKCLSTNGNCTCSDCKFYTGNGYEECIKNVSASALDIIHRLQDEIKEYETVFDIYNQRKYRKMFNEEWKKEYQKELDKQGKGVIAGFPDGDYVYQRYFEQKAEIERLTEAMSDFRQEVITLNIEKLELKKQVDDLTETQKETLQSVIDKIEQGTLIELPCKVGDTVYWLFTTNIQQEIYECYVTGFIYNRKGLDICLSKKCLNGYAYFTLKDIGKNVFLTREEAEKRLKELQK